MGPGARLGGADTGIKRRNSAPRLKSGSRNPHVGLRPCRRRAACEADTFEAIHCDGSDLGLQPPSRPSNCASACPRWLTAFFSARESSAAVRFSVSTKNTGS